MRKTKLTIFLAVLSLALFGFTKQSLALSAFPGAEGFGANAVGGRGGAVVKVTNLNDSGSGSLRAAATATGARIVVFDVSGIINLTSDITISNPYITIAGQTSPGGILVAGRAVTVNTHDVIFQHMRFRVGTSMVVYQKDNSGNIIYYNQPQYNFPPTGGVCQGTITTESLGYPCAISGGANPETLGALNIFGNSVLSWHPNAAYNIIIDHCSISWGVDENFDVGLGATDVTIQWSIVSEGLSKAGHPKGEHSKGLLFSDKYTSTQMNVSAHHNYFVHNRGRNPYICCGSLPITADIVNNVVYNFYGSLSMASESLDHVNWVHNYVKRGPGSNANVYEAINFASSPAAPSVYMEGNIGTKRLNQTADEWSIGRMWYNELLDTGYRTLTRWLAPTVTTQISSAQMANDILADVGATKPFRDSVDVRIINDFSTNTGAYLNNVSYPNDFPVFANLAAPADADNDGMADTWEQSYGLSTTINDSALDKDSDGYTNIEEYLHFLSVDMSLSDTTPPSAPQGLVVN